MDYYKNIDILEYINDSDYITSLNNISRYLDYAIDKTIKKQVIYNIDNLEKTSAERILYDYLKGKKEAFTRENNIRYNLKEIGETNILNALIKNAIMHKVKKEQIDKEIFDEFDDDILATEVCDYLRNNKYKDLIKVLTNNKYKMNLLISMYVDDAYKISDDKRELLDTLAMKSNIANESLEVLENSLKERDYVI